jgi:signal transduction histidine kinase
VSERFLASRVAPAAEVEAKVSRILADERLVFGEPVRRGSGHRATRTLVANGISWTVEVEPMDAAGFVAMSMQRSNLYLAMLLVVLALLAVGGYLTARTVRRELEVARQKSDFVSTVSHEFRSPLTGIRQLAEMLSRDRVLDHGKRQQYYDLMLRESERLGRLVESVLDFARMEDGRKRYRLEPLDTTAWLRGVAKEFEGDAARVGFSLETSIPDDLPRVNGDCDALATAVHNLLDNAVKYSPGSKTVWLDAKDMGGRVRIRVRDRGVGIPAGRQSQIFERFYRVDGELSKHVKGVGLGLSLVRHIVESHHGTVSVVSRQGEGSTFAIELAAA